MTLLLPDMFNIFYLVCDCDKIKVFTWMWRFLILSVMCLVISKKIFPSRSPLISCCLIYHVSFVLLSRTCLRDLIFWRVQVTSRAERRLHELEREMVTEKRSAEGGRPEQWAAMSNELQEVTLHCFTGISPSHSHGFTLWLSKFRKRTWWNYIWKIAGLIMDWSENLAETSNKIGLG